MAGSPAVTKHVAMVARVNECIQGRRDQPVIVDATARREPLMSLIVRKGKLLKYVLGDEIVPTTTGKAKSRKKR
jgi:hypothetical protein